MECGRVAHLKSEKFWSSVSCNTNRCSNHTGTKGEYANLPTNRKRSGALLAICDVDTKYQLSDWEKDRIKVNRDLALKVKKKETQRRADQHVRRGL